MTLENPWGLLSLFGVAALIAIYCFVRKPQRWVISTLFLIPRQTAVQPHGHWFRRLQRHASFWAALVVVLTLVILLCEIAWNRHRAAHRCIVVVDGSYSMEASRPALVEIGDNLTTWAANNHEPIEWMLFDSGHPLQALYNSANAADFRQALAAWIPTSSAHDPERAIETIRRTVGADARVLYLTDHPWEKPPAGVLVQAVGQPLPNVGFSGVHYERELDGWKWQVYVSNYSDQAQTRPWSIEVAGSSQPQQAVAIEAGGITALEGFFPDAIDRAVLRLENDAFTLDDSLPLLPPARCLIRMENRITGSATKWVDRVASSLSEVKAIPSGTGGDLIVSPYLPDWPKESAPFWIAFAEARQQPPGAVNSLPAPSLAQSHPLTERLNWTGFVALPSNQLNTWSKGRELQLEPLLWANNQPLAMLYDDGARLGLLFDCSLVRSNAAETPAMILLINRFVEKVRARSLCGEVLNCALNEPLAQAITPTSLSMKQSFEPLNPAWQQASAPHLSLRYAPPLPGFFSIGNSSETLLQGAATFTDIQEADLRHCSAGAPFDPASILVESTGRIPLQQTKYLSWLLLVSLLGVGATWYFLSKEGL